MPAVKLRVAAIDLGTNSFHMVIVEESEGKGIVEIDRVKDMICIGRGSISTKLLDEDAMQAGVATLKNFLVLANQHGVPPDHIIAFATSAIREAKNRDFFIDKVRKETGLKVKVISGREEAQFIYYGVRNAVMLGEKPDLLFDIGGGSVEFVIASEKDVMLLESRKIGVARMFERFITTDPLSKSELKLLEQFFAAEMSSSAEKAKELHVTRGIASSGTAQNIARMIQSVRESDASLNSHKFTREEFQRLYQTVMPLNSEERRKLTGLDEKRVDLIVPGLILIDTVFKVFNLEEMMISDSALREGMVLHYIGRLRDGKRISREHLDIRRQSVTELGYRCDWHKPHSKQVAKLSVQLFDQLQGLHGLDPKYRELLEYAALLHNIGAFISIAGHHKHSQYIIMNGELRGFSPAEIEIIGNVARYHRKSPPSDRHPLYSKLSPQHKRVVDVLSGILRLANGLERGHRQNVLTVVSRIEPEQVVLTVKTRFEPDIEFWAADTLKLWLEEVLMTSVVIELQGRHG